MSSDSNLELYYNCMLLVAWVDFISIEGIVFLPLHLRYLNTKQKYWWGIQNIILGKQPYGYKTFGLEKNFHCFVS